MPATTLAGQTVKCSVCDRDMTVSQYPGPVYAITPHVRRDGNGVFVNCPGGLDLTAMGRGALNARPEQFAIAARA